MSFRIRYILLFVGVISVLYLLERILDNHQTDVPPYTTEDLEDHSSRFEWDLFPTTSNGVKIQHSYYALSYREDHEQAEWVAYELTKDQLSNKEYERPYFIEDEEVASKSADWRNYKKSGYDRGHLCPAGDRRFSSEAYSETFLTSNISPQNRAFNSGIWNFLEQRVRVWAKKYKRVYVITGGVLKKDLPTIGYEGISVPEQFYKIVLDVRSNDLKVIAFLIPNRPVSESYFDYVVKVDHIEEITGIDFFPQLPDTIEDNLEAMVDLKNWK